MGGAGEDTGPYGMGCFYQFTTQRPRGKENSSCKRGEEKGIMEKNGGKRHEIRFYIYH